MQSLKYTTSLVLLCTVSCVSFVSASWRDYAGRPGPGRWRCNVICPDPEDHGPDGMNLNDWDGDGDLDVFVNYEEGRYSRLFFNPGSKKVSVSWPDYVEFQHGQCEDSGMGDLDNDGDIDYIANGGWVYFNPGKSMVRDSSKWTKMTLFDYERRVPIVADVDGDGLNDLIVGAQEWYKQPVLNKHKAENWVKYTIGKNRWPMNCILTDVDGDGDADIVVPDRGVEICWYVNPGKSKVTGKWQRKTLHKHHEPMFMAVADVDGDRIDDFIITGGSKGDLARKVIILLRTNKKGDPSFKEILIDQPSGNFPKGVAVLDQNGDKKKEILVIPKQGDIWLISCTGDSMKENNWKADAINIPGSEIRKKMDNAWLSDLDGDGDQDVLTTEENGGWGVIWFENPENAVSGE
ncbi:MAG: VCBS repeat-containing protein [Phycisphaerae bacterium]|nr:VCBS repeat-containing protein [Phycisphaerae bacterium]